MYYIRYLWGQQDALAVFCNLTSNESFMLTHIDWGPKLKTVVKDLAGPGLRKAIQCLLLRQCILRVLKPDNSRVVSGAHIS